MFLILFYIILGLIIGLYLMLTLLRWHKISRVLEKIDMDIILQGEFSLLTYNVAGLPERISSALTPRRESMIQIGELISDFDIVHVQEDFNYNRFLYEKNTHLYRTKHKGKVPFGDGLNTLSKYPILEYRRIPWRHCTGSDCLTPKGFTYTKIKLAKNIYIDVYNVHANSHYAPKASYARQHNINQLKQYIYDHSADQALLVLGDFNAHYAFKLDNLPLFVKETGLYDGWVDLVQDGHFPEVDDHFMPLSMLELTNSNESIDKIYYRSSKHLIFTPQEYNIEDKKFVAPSGKPLSDHLAVSMRFKWEWKEEIT
jgi:endonuclease/exonuclease/phosphatase family metal-dependent hydrolase